MKTHNPIITRYKKNPILTRKDVPYPVATVHNAGIVKHNDRYIMLFRSHLLNGRSIIGRADSEDGFSFKVHPKPFLTPSVDGIFAEYEAFGVEDLRICPV
ncbi:MAG: glycosidase, partial [Proteobacteria bacterium]|nr:glycosidase [Pseudomonadota bacterium]